MKLPTARWLLTPLRQLRTRQLMARHGPTLPYDTAWALIALHGAPDETALVRAWAHENHGAAPGVHYDHWHTLSTPEQHRRLTWLRRHGRSPIRLLQLDAGLMHSTGLHVLGWGRPLDPAEQHSAQALRLSRPARRSPCHA
ncbi:hypothetical protein [Streptomyces sp. NK08204]|uniref:hypothetical protein n=1 Tax=Streptomyces sp. NK08204 TaxID=2873260 RepID=UPI001CED3CA2|nr:hypothetical protein [Streptomyces sp. NK08204]